MRDDVKSGEKSLAEDKSGHRGNAAPLCKACGVPLTLVGHGIGFECINDACVGCNGTRAIGMKTDETIPCPITGRMVEVVQLVDCPGCGDCNDALAHARGDADHTSTTPPPNC